MESTQNPEKQKNKNKNWLFLLIGVLVGFVLSLSLYLIDKHFFPNHIYLTKTIERIMPGDKADETVAIKQAPVQNESLNRRTEQVADTLRVDTLFAESYDRDLDEVDFMMDDYEGEQVAEAKIVANKRVKVHFVDADTLKPAATEYFIVEQWNSPIKTALPIIVIIQC